MCLSVLISSLLRGIPSLRWTVMECTHIPLYLPYSKCNAKAECVDLAWLIINMFGYLCPNNTWSVDSVHINWSLINVNWSMLFQVLFSYKACTWLIWCLRLMSLAEFLFFCTYTTLGIWEDSATSRLSHINIPPVAHLMTSKLVWVRHLIFKKSLRYNVRVVPISQLEFCKLCKVLHVTYYSIQFIYGWFGSTCTCKI